MPKQTVEITFPEVERDTANALAESLAKDVRREVKDEGKPIDPEVRRTDPTAQDFGTTLAIILGTPAVIALANAVRDWAKRNDRSVLKINGVVVRDVASKDVAEIIKAINNVTK